MSVGNPVPDMVGSVERALSQPMSFRCGRTYTAACAAPGEGYDRAKKGTKDASASPTPPMLTPAPEHQEEDPASIESGLVEEPQRRRRRWDYSTGSRWLQDGLRCSRSSRWWRMLALARLGAT